MDNLPEELPSAPSSRNQMHDFYIVLAIGITVVAVVFGILLVTYLSQAR